MDGRLAGRLVGWMDGWRRGMAADKRVAWNGEADGWLFGGLKNEGCWRKIASLPTG